jgi:hypothetical protein
MNALTLGRSVAFLSLIKAAAGARPLAVGKQRVKPVPNVTPKTRTTAAASARTTPTAKPQAKPVPSAKPQVKRAPSPKAKTQIPRQSRAAVNAEIAEAPQPMLQGLSEMLGNTIAGGSYHLDPRLEKGLISMFGGPQRGAQNLGATALGAAPSLYYMLTDPRYGSSLEPKNSPYYIPPAYSPYGYGAAPDYPTIPR